MTVDGAAEREPTEQRRAGEDSTCITHTERERAQSTATGAATSHRAGDTTKSREGVKPWERDRETEDTTAVQGARDC